MTTPGHGGARVGAGRKAHANHKVKRSVSLSVAADACVLAQMRVGESYSTTLERMLQTTSTSSYTRFPPAPLELLLERLHGERQSVAELYRTLGWSRQRFAQFIQRERMCLAQLGIRLHVATKDAASGRRERYITVDGVR